MNVDVLVVGAGPAGLAAAETAARCGAQVLVCEREPAAGGILPQCVHDGFGMHLFGRSLTGPEYAEEWYERAQRAGVQFAFCTSVLSVEVEKDSRLKGSSLEGSPLEGAPQSFAVQTIGKTVGGQVRMQAKAVVVATGCRERVRGALNIPGTRPSGIMTAGQAQYLVNRRNLLPGRRVVILGSGDIGLIMARRMSIEGAEVRLVLGAAGTGLLRNHVRCIEDFGIPFRSGWGVAKVHGKGRLSAVTVAPLREDGTFDLSAKERIPCDLLLLACGLIPEREVLDGLGGAHPDGLFVCGNATHPHDLVDQVTQEGIACGMKAAQWVGLDGQVPADLRYFLDATIQEPKGRLSDLSSSEKDISSMLVCTTCPTGCIVSVGRNGRVEGHRCARGEAYAREELERPQRMFTGTVRLEDGTEPLLPVRTSAEVPRQMLLEVQRICRRTVATAPIQVGQVVIPKVCGTDVDVVACATHLGKFETLPSSDLQDARGSE